MEGEIEIGKMELGIKDDDEDEEENERIYKFQVILSNH